jgi:DNA-binding Lrp family transcriptional regulator
MDVENEFIKPVISFYYNEGLNEQEARKEITKKYGPYGITMRTINKWYSLFKLDEIPDKKTTFTSHKISDESLINLIKENPDLNMTELGKLANTTASVISIRLREINSDGERVKYKSKRAGRQKLFTDEFLINLASENPNAGITELASLAGVSFQVVSRRINQINKFEERIKYKSKKTGKQPKFTDEFLINLVNENPGITMQKLGELSGVSTSTIWCRLNKIKSKGEIIKYNHRKCKNNKPENNQKPKIKITDQRIIDLVNENPKLNMSELAKLADISISTVSRRIKIIKNSGKLLDYGVKKHQKEGPKKVGRPRKFTDAYLIRLINDNPDISMNELAKLASVNANTMFNRIKKINCEDIKVKYISKNNVSKFSDELIINLVNDNPELNLEELSKLIGTSVRTLSRRLKQINSNGDVVNYVKKTCAKNRSKTHRIISY